MVLSTAYVLKEQMLIAIEQRHASERAYQEAANNWQRATSNPEAHSQWLQFYANALQDALRKAHNRRKEALEGLTTADWWALVYRELQFDHWYEEPSTDLEINQVEEEEHIEQRPLVLSVNGTSRYHPIET